MATIVNGWKTLAELKNGVTVKRKFGGFHTEIDEDDNVLFVHVKYWYREFYPNGEIIKSYKRYYALEDLAATVTEEWRQEPLAVLSGFIAQLGQPFIVDAALETLESVETLPIDHEDGYPLRKDTREKIML